MGEDRKQDEGRFRFGVCEWSLKARGRDLCSEIRQAGLTDLQAGVGTEIFSGMGLADERRREEYLEADEEFGVKVTSVSPQFVDDYSFTHPSSTQEEEVTDHLIREAIRMCGIFRCGSFLLPVLGKNDIRDGASFHRAVRKIREYSEMASAQGIMTCLEINQSVSVIRDLLDAVDSPMLKIFFDSQNMYAAEGTCMVRCYRELQDVIGGIHVKDGLGPVLSGSLLGEGDSGFFRTVEAIRESSYSGSVFIESVYSNPAVASLGEETNLLKKDADTLKKAFGIQTSVQ